MVSNVSWLGCVLVTPFATAPCILVSRAVALLRRFDVIDRIYRYMIHRFIPDVISVVMVILSDIDYESEIVMLHEILVALQDLS